MKKWEKKMRKIFLSVFAFVFLSYSFVFAKTANEWVAEGDSYLEVHDTVNAYRCYSEAYEIDPNNQDVNFGLAILNLPHFLIDGGDSDVNNFLLENGICIIGDIYDLIVSDRDVEENSTIPQMQDFINSHILPYVTQTLGYFNKITPSFQKTIKKEMQPYEAWKDAEMNEGSWCLRQYQSGKLVKRDPWGGEYLLLPSRVEVDVWWQANSYDESVISNIESVSETVTTPAGTFTNCVKVSTTYPPNEWDPNEYKEIDYYKQDVGWVKYVFMINSEVIEAGELVSYSGSGTGYWPLEEGNQWDYEWISIEDSGYFSYLVTSVSPHQEIEGVDKECDYSDILAAKGFVNLVKGVLDIGCAYNLDVDRDDTKDKNLKEILDEYPDVFKIKDQTKMDDALTCFQNFFDCLINSYDSINNETDNQDDDLLVFPKDDEEFNYFKDDIRNLLSDLRELLNPSGKSFDITDLILKMNYYKSDAPIKFPKKINLSKFFTNPITRTNITQLDFDENGKVIFSSLWNVDQTLNGVFPDMSQKEFIGYFNGGLHLDVEIAGENSNYLWGEIYGDIDFEKDILNVKIYRNTTPSVNESSTLIATITPADPNFEIGDNDAHFNLIDYNAPGDNYYYRGIVNYKDGSYSMSSAERAAKKLYVNKNATGIYKGTSDKPYKDISMAVEYGNPGATICVAKGIYSGSCYDWTIESNTSLLGGYEATNWTRDIKNNVTIIDGSGKEGNVVGIYDVNNVVVDGFIIKNGFYNGVGLINSQNVLVRNCTLTQNNDNGIWADSSSVQIEKCTITRNYGGGGGWASNISMANCTFDNNNYYGIYLYSSTGQIINSVISQCGGVGIQADYSNVLVNNCTIDNNQQGGIYLSSSDSQIKNSILSNNGMVGIEIYNSDWNILYNDVWNNGCDYLGISDQTGINGNISENPLFVDPENGNYRLSENSPCIGAGEGGVDMGAYPYVEFTEKKGDINEDEGIDISDVILCLRMALGLPVTIQGETYTSYPDSLVNCANINGDGEIDISDVILCLRMALGLPITINGQTYYFPYDGL